MGFNVTKLFKKESKDALIFQIAESFIEVAAVRRIEEGYEDSCYTESFYSQRLHRVVAKKGEQKKMLDTLALNIQKLAEGAIVAKELAEEDFSVAEARVVCIFVEPLSRVARTVRSLSLEKQTKITAKLLTKTLTKGDIVLDELKSMSQDYAVYAEELDNVELNGYSTQRPLGKEAVRIDITTTTRLTTARLWTAVGSVLERTFHRELIYMHKGEAIELDSAELCDEIYTGSELQEIANTIL